MKKNLNSNTKEILNKKPSILYAFKLRLLTANEAVKWKAVNAKGCGKFECSQGEYEHHQIIH